MSDCVKPGAPAVTGASLKGCSLSVLAGGDLIPDADTIEVVSGGELTSTKDGNRDVINFSVDGGFLSIKGDFTIKKGAAVPHLGEAVIDDSGRYWVVTEAPSYKSFGRGKRPLMVTLALEFHPAVSVAEGGSDDGYFDSLGTAATYSFSYALIKSVFDDISSITLAWDEALFRIASAGADANLLTLAWHSYLSPSATNAEAADLFEAGWVENSSVLFSRDDDAETVTLTMVERGTAGNDYTVYWSSPWSSSNFTGGLDPE